MKPVDLDLTNVRQCETDKVPWDNKKVTFILISNCEVCIDHTYAGKLAILDKIEPSDLL